MNIKNNLFNKVIVLEILLFIIGLLFMFNNGAKYLVIVRVLEHILVLYFYLYSIKNINKYIVIVIFYSLLSRFYLIFNDDHSINLTVLVFVNILMLFYINKDFKVKKTSKLQAYSIFVMLVILSISLYIIFSFSNISLNSIDVVFRIIFSQIILFSLFFLSFVNVLATKGRGNLKFFIAVFICVSLNVSYTLFSHFSVFIYSCMYPVLYSLALFLLVASNIEREEALFLKD